MELRLSVVGDEADDAYTAKESESLYWWLTQDPQLRETTRITRIPKQSLTGAMGVDLDSVNVVLSNSLAAINLLVTSVVGWRSTRSRPAPVRIDQAGTTVTTVDGTSDELRELPENLDHGPGPDAPRGNGPAGSA
ncbi:effector-associated constant component EACC1 [Streptomyces erythrochromogenes]|uniref:effector-associated constant component EACC1 n=1 Tax=Streptomyces erythrochromogenes TaxID=285574 RepID=UPI0033DE8D3D